MEQAKQDPPDVDDASQGWQTDYSAATTYTVNNVVGNYKANIKNGKLPADSDPTKPQKYLKTYLLSYNDMYIEMEITDKRNSRNLGTADDPNIINVEPEMPDVDYVIIPYKDSSGRLVVGMWEYEGTKITPDQTSDRIDNLLMDNSPPAIDKWPYEYSYYFFDKDNSMTSKKYTIGTRHPFVKPEDVSVDELKRGHNIVSDISQTIWNEISADDSIGIYLDASYAVEEFGLDSKDPSEEQTILKMHFSVDEVFADESPEKKLIIYENDPSNSFELDVEEWINRGKVDFVRGYINDPEDEASINDSNDYYWIVVNVYNGADKKMLLATTDTSIRKK